MSMEIIFTTQLCKWFLCFLVTKLVKSLYTWIFYHTNAKCIFIIRFIIYMASFFFLFLLIINYYILYSLPIYPFDEWFMRVAFYFRLLFGYERLNIILSFWMTYTMINKFVNDETMLESRSSKYNLHLLKSILWKDKCCRYVLFIADSWREGGWI